VAILQEHLDAADRLDYKPTPWTTLARALSPREVRPDDVFVDFGAGKGRVVFLAARYPFKRVVGVEVSAVLSAVARDNVERSRARLRCREVEIVTSDVLDYAIPDDMSVAFFFNPFRGHVFATVVERLLASVDIHPRRLRLIYRNPAEHELLMATGRFRLVRRVRGMRPTAAWSRTNATYVYEVTTGDWGEPASPQPRSSTALDPSPRVG
jgi:SAM-dependent methyltransferase